MYVWRPRLRSVGSKVIEKKRQKFTIKINAQCTGQQQQQTYECQQLQQQQLLQMHTTTTATRVTTTESRIIQTTYSIKVIRMQLHINICICSRSRIFKHCHSHSCICICIFLAAAFVLDPIRMSDWNHMKRDARSVDRTWLKRRPYRIQIFVLVKIPTGPRRRTGCGIFWINVEKGETAGTSARRAGTGAGAGAGLGLTVGPG